MKDRLIGKRFGNIMIMFVVTFLVTAAICVFSDRFTDELLLYGSFTMIFFVLFVFVLEYQRVKGLLSGNRATTFRNVLTGYSLSCATAACSVFAPEFLKPVLFFPIFMTACSNTNLALYVGIFWSSVICLVAETSTFEFLQYVLLVLFGCMVAEALEDWKMKLWCALMLVCLSAMLPGVFYYLTYREFQVNMLLFGALEGFAIDLFLLVFYPSLVGKKRSELVRLIDHILSDSYSLNQEFANFSKADYTHAKRVSALAAKCAAQIGADEKICEAAGFYYRLGIIEGPAIVENGVYLSQKACFPEEVSRIISEYYGEQALPSSIESAIVHMVDGLVKKLEFLDAGTMSSEWNQDMVIYQTLNDFSAQGLYDASGLSMNMFLKIREYLVKEEALI